MSLIEDCAGLAGAEPQTWGTSLMNDTIFVGLDVHKETIAVAVAEAGAAARCCNSAIFSTGLITSRSWSRGWPGAVAHCRFVMKPGHAAMAFCASSSPSATTAWWRRRRSFGESGRPGQERIDATP